MFAQILRDRLAPLALQQQDEERRHQSDLCLDLRGKEFTWDSEDDSNILLF